MRASASPQIVREPLADANAVDPEEAFIASVASCHMLFFLDYAAQAGFTIDAYEDTASGTLTAGPEAGSGWTQLYFCRESASLVSASLRARKLPRFTSALILIVSLPIR